MCQWVIDKWVKWVTEIDVTWILGQIHLIQILLTHAPSLITKCVYVTPASLDECEKHFNAFNARKINSALRNNIFPKAVEAVSVVFEGYKTGLLK